MDTTEFFKLVNQDNMDPIIFTKVNDNHYNVVTPQNMLIGELLRDVDAYFYFWISPNIQGCWSAYVLHLISNKLNLLNSEVEFSGDDLVQSVEDVANSIKQ